MSSQLLYVFDDTRCDATMKMDQAKIAEYEAKLIYAKTTTSALTNCIRKVSPQKTKWKAH